MRPPGPSRSHWSAPRQPIRSRRPSWRPGHAIQGALEELAAEVLPQPDLDHAVPDDHRRAPAGRVDGEQAGDSWQRDRPHGVTALIQDRDGV